MAENIIYKHTPGPWRISDPSEYKWELEECGTLGEKTLTILGDDGYGVLSIPVSITDGYPKSATARANAKLIAAAPRLLHCCQCVLDGYDHPERDGEFDWVDMACELREAIKEATDD